MEQPAVGVCAHAFVDLFQLLCDSGLSVESLYGYWPLRAVLPAALRALAGAFVARLAATRAPLFLVEPESARHQVIGGGRVDGRMDGLGGWVDG